MNTPLKPGGIMGERISRVQHAPAGPALFEMPAAATARQSGAEDPLLGCLLLINRARQRPVSSIALQEWLPRQGGINLTLSLLGTAAEYFGLSTQLVDCSLDEISDTMLPAILLLAGNRPCVLLRRGEYGQLTVALPGWGGGVQEVGYDELQAQYSGHAVLAQPAPKPEFSGTTELPQPCPPSSMVLQPAWPGHGERLLASTLKVLRLAGRRLKMWPALVASTVSRKQV
ncbi:cysteine peptidase family C39 domain-containing protein [Cupriavidus sp. WKF15]|uniref:cysteine peptidase family C39 domain-containing protein n=1 Tax=Cupriavidus sp. WKF15 TaxID=3032282 RepID=UPI0023E1194B|nr:cysteine peptidase family C39 domain-containing protein [Cupriavidus sp. WKF15]WER47349.1 cysteine peptidase family C39 domain-containing protein [Cupriavidus sp. WKF15]